MVDLLYETLTIAKVCNTFFRSVPKKKKKKTDPTMHKKSSINANASHHHPQRNTTAKEDKLLLALVILVCVLLAFAFVLSLLIDRPEFRHEDGHLKNPMQFMVDAFAINED